MDEPTRHRLNAINRQFYATTATEFDQTRGTAWLGWGQIFPHLPAAPLNVLDVGCGNGRFGVYIAQNHPHPITYTGLDNNAALLDYARATLEATPNITATLQTRDVVEQPPDDGQYDLIGVFGVLHHVPGEAARRAFIQAVAACLKPGGILAMACWRFHDYERFRRRIVPWPDDLRDHVEAGDHLLDWRRGEVALRYCHHVDDDEHAVLVAATGLREVITYRADGFDNAVNRYSLLKADL